MEERPIAQATASRNNIINVYPDRVELISGWQGQNVESVSHREVSGVGVRGLVNCTLTIETNMGRLFRLEGLGLSEANTLKSTIEQQKQKAGGLYE